MVYHDDDSILAERGSGLLALKETFPKLRFVVFDKAREENSSWLIHFSVLTSSASVTCFLIWTCSLL